jgi:hypothetical protein
MTNECDLEKIRKEADMVWSRYYPGIYLEGLRKTTKVSVKIEGEEHAKLTCLFAKRIYIEIKQEKIRT